MSTRRDRQQIPRVLAGKVLSDLRIEAPDEIDIEAIAAHYDCFVRDGGIEGADGRVLSDGKRSIIRVRTDITETPRRRYVIAHELGHVRLKHQRTLTFCSDGDLVRYDGGDAEPEANAFASELLMPARMFTPRVGRASPSLGAVEELARVFRTSFTATAIRLVDLAREPCAVVWCERGRVKWCVTSDECPWFVPRGRAVSPETFAADAFAGAPLPIRSERVPGDAWAEGYAVPNDLLEETRWFKSFGATFSLLRAC